MFYLLKIIYYYRMTLLLSILFFMGKIINAQEIFKSETIEQIDTIAHHIDEAKKLFAELNAHTHLVDKRSHRSKENKTKNRFYINARNITTPIQKYIITQAPRKKDNKEFFGNSCSITIVI